MIQDLPTDVLAYCIRYLADSSDMFRQPLGLCRVSRRFRDAGNEMFQQYDGVLVPPIVAQERARQMHTEAHNEFREMQFRLSDPEDEERAVNEVENLVQHVLPRTPLVREIDFGGFSFDRLRPASPAWLAVVDSLPTIAPHIIKLDLSSVQGIRNFSFIAHYAPILECLCLSDVPQQPNDVHTPFAALSRCLALTKLVLQFDELQGIIEPNENPAVNFASRANFGYPDLNACNRLSFLEGPVASTLKHLTLVDFHFSVNRAEDHSIAKAVNLETLELNACNGLRHIFFVRKLQHLECLDISGSPIAHRRSERTLRMLADLPNLKTLLMDSGFWVKHSHLLGESRSLRYITTGGRYAVDEWEPTTNANGEPLTHEETCYGIYGEDCPEDFEVEVSDTDDEYL